MNINFNCVYRIYSNLPHITECYIGSTRNLKLRISEHKHNAKILNNKLSLYFRLHDFNNFKFETLAHIGTYNKNNLLLLERLYYNQYNPSLNSNVPNQTIEEWRDKNKELINKNITLYRCKNRELVNFRSNERYNNNKDLIKNNNLDYYYKNKDKIKKRINFICACACGDKIKWKDRKAHLKTDEHHNNLLIHLVHSKNAIIS